MRAGYLHSPNGNYQNISSTQNNLLIVADDDQSIYGFRGAYPQGLLDFNKHYNNGKIFYGRKL